MDANQPRLMNSKSCHVHESSHKGVGEGTTVLWTRVHFELNWHCLGVGVQWIGLDSIRLRSAYVRYRGEPTTSLSEYNCNEVWSSQLWEKILLVPFFCPFSLKTSDNSFSHMGCKKLILTQKQGEEQVNSCLIISCGQLYGIGYTCFCGTYSSSC